MSTLEARERMDAPSRPAFDYFEGFAVTSIFASLEMAGLLDTLAASALGVDPAPGERAEETALRNAALAYLGQRGIAALGDGRFTLTDLGQALYRDKGYLVWIAGGYGEPLNHLGRFLGGAERYGRESTRDGRWVATGAAQLGAQDVVPEAMRLLETIAFDRVVDLGCGNARFLVRVCKAFGSSGVGVDISPEACEEAVKGVEAAGLRDRIEIVQGDAVDLAGIPHLRDTQLVITFFLLHEISSQSRAALIRFLSQLSTPLPDGAHLLVAEVVPALGERATSARFTPEFTFVHAMMRQSLLDERSWREAFAQGGFFVQEAISLDMPGGILLLAQKTNSWC
jgi:SAM-dependent methyltransferase